MHIIEPKRMIEMVEAAYAREGKNSLTEKASLWSAFFMGIIYAPDDALMRLLWKRSMTDIMSDIIRAYYPDDAERKEFTKALNQCTDALKADMKDAAGE